MKESTLTTTGLNSFSVLITEDAEKRKSDALELAATIKAVSSTEQQQDAVTAAGILKGLINGMEKTRKEVKQPILDAGREVDDCAKLYSNTLERELKRVEGLASDWQRLENKRLDVIREEQERQNREAEAAAEAERRVYLKMIQQEADEVAKEAIQKAADAAAEANAEAARARQTTITEIPAAGVAGARVKASLDYEVLDIRVLALARPDLVTIEPKRSLLLAAINIPGATIPGIRTFESVKVQSKAIL